MAYQADIRISVKGAKQLDALSKAADKLAPQIDQANAAFIRLSGATKQTLPIVANLRTELEKSKKAFQSSVLGSKAAVDAAKNQVNAERLLNNELERRNSLLNAVRAGGFGPRQATVGEKAAIQKQQKKDELLLQEALGAAQNESLNNIAKKIQLKDREIAKSKILLGIEKQRAVSPKFGEVAGSSFGRRGGSIGPALPSSGAGSTIRSMNRTGFAAFSKRASEIEKTTKAEIALSKSRTAAAQKLKSLESIERRRAKTESFGANFRRFRRGRTSADRAVRGRVGSSALIGGGFPLLFGGGPISALAGGLGGGIGELFGKGGGFAGSIAATAIAQTIQQAVTAISELGQALGPFTQDTQAATVAMGLQGSAQEAQLKRIERTQGKTAAFNAAMKMMENRIGESGVRKIQEFGETTRILGTIFGTALLKLQAFAAGVVDFVAKLLTGEQKLKEAEINQVVADAAAGGNKEAQALLNRGTEIQETGFRKTSRGMKAKPSTQGKINELKRDKEIFAIRNKISLTNDEITSKSQTLVEEKRKEFELNEKINNLINGGMNPALAKSLATVEQTFDEEQKILEQKALQAEEDLRKAINTKADLDTQKLLKDEFLAHTIELGKHNKLRKDAIDLTKQLNDETNKFAQSLEGPIKEGIKGLIKGTSTLADMLNKVADKFLDLAIDQAFGSFGGGGIFGFLGNIFKANGGPVAGGNPYVVGEKGPELFVPKSSGTIVPNNQLGGGGSTSVVVNVDASGTSAEGDEPDAAQLGRIIGSVVQAELVKESRPGGLLSSTR